MPRVASAFRSAIVRISPRSSSPIKLSKNAQTILLFGEPMLESGRLLQHRISLGPKGVIQLDAQVLGRPDFRMPLDPRLASWIAHDVYDVIWSIHASRSSPLSFLLMARSRIASALGIGISAWAMARQLRIAPMSGWSVSADEPKLEFFNRVIDSPIDHTRLNKIKVKLGLVAQFILLRLVDVLGFQRPVLQVSNDPLDPALGRKWVWRIRGFTSLFDRPARLRPDDERNIALLAGDVLQQLERALARRAVPLTEYARKRIGEFLESELRRACSDWRNLQRWFGRRRFDFYGGTVCSYGRALVAFLATKNGGDAHSTVHGGNVYGNTFEGNLMELFNASVAWVPSEKAARNARAIVERRCPSLNIAALRVQSENPLLKYDRPHATVGRIRRIVVMGAPVVLEISAIGALQAPCYIDIEKRLCDLLAQQGYDITYKPHPENSWRGHHLIFDPRVQIEYRPYEQIENGADAVIYAFHVSSTLITDLGSSRKIFLLRDGWHESFWLPSVWQELESRCEVIPARLDEMGRIQIDEASTLQRLSSTVPVNRNGFYEFIGDAC
jgi:hypothetical protein